MNAPAAPPALDLTVDTVESQTDMFVLIENQGVVVTAEFTVDSTTSGLFIGANSSFGGPAPNLVPGTIGVGLVVDSFLLHIDNVPSSLGGGTINPGDLVASVTFDAPIIGVIALAPQLNASDSLFQPANTIYQFGGPRGFFDSRLDTFEVSSDLRTIIVTPSVGTFMDEIRVIVASPSVIPVPAALPLLLTGLAGLGLIGWRRRKAA